MVWSCMVLYRWPCLLWVCECDSHTTTRRQHFTAPLPPSGFYNLFASFSRWSLLELWLEWGMPLKTCHSGQSSWSPQMDLGMGAFSLLGYKALTLKNCILLVDLISGLVRKDLVDTTKTCGVTPIKTWRGFTQSHGKVQNGRQFQFHTEKYFPLFLTMWTWLCRKEECD